MNMRIDYLHNYSPFFSNDMALWLTASTLSILRKMLWNQQRAYRESTVELTYPYYNALPSQKSGKLMRQFQNSSRQIFDFQRHLLLLSSITDLNGMRFRSKGKIYSLKMLKIMLVLDF